MRVSVGMRVEEMVTATRDGGGVGMRGASDCVYVTLMACRITDRQVLSSQAHTRLPSEMGNIIHYEQLVIHALISLLLLSFLAT